VRSFNQDPRFCLCVLAEIACRALSPAVNDPGTAIDVIGRGVRVLSEYGRHIDQKNTVRYPAIHISPLSTFNLLDDFFSPIARDGAAMREVQLRLLKGMAMLSQAWPDLYASAAGVHAREVLQYIEKASYISSDKARIMETYQKLFNSMG